MAAGDVDAAAGLVAKLVVPAHRQGRVATVQRWLRWLEDRGGIEGHPMVAVLAALFWALTGRPVEAERWADAVDRWQYGDPARPSDPSTEAWAAVLRTFLCRHGAEQMRADADEAVRRFAAQSFVTPAPAFLQGIARVLCGDLDGGDASLQDGVSVGEKVGAHEDVALALCERSLAAMARSEWGQAEVLADQARTVLRRAGIEESYAAPLVSAVQARTAMHRGDIPAARQQLLSAQHLRPLLTYALPYFAVQARIELVRVHLALADLAAARTLMREVDIAAIANSHVFVANAHYVFASLRAWGWITLIIAVLQLIAAGGILAGNQLARWFAVAVVGLNAIDMMFFIPAYPFWALAIIAMDVVALYGLCAYGSRQNLEAA
jgi:LuxR family transcriptional regulator, maltose regulon positive regulatory protein